MIERFNDRRDWFFEKRFGLFVHWGFYSMIGLHEQVWQRWNLKAEDYVKLSGNFNPVKFDPDAWLDLAEAAGMEYICFTTKHHDGFCMWDSSYTDFNIMYTPYGKDTLAMLAEACHRRNFPLVLYYSVVDWHHPAYPNIGRHHEINTDPAWHNFDKYMEFLKNQLRELCTNYGIIHGIWWDMNVSLHKDPSVNAMIRKLQPCAVINNRGFDDGDFSTPERDWDPENSNPDEGTYRMVEACQSVGVNSWGYRKEEDYFSSQYLMQCMDKWLADGANYLLNVGPDANGKIPLQAVRILKNIGNWMRHVRPAFNGNPDAQLLKNNKLKVICDGNILYVHCPLGVISSTLSMYPLTDRPENITLMNNGQSLDWTLEPVVYQRDSVEKVLRIRNIPADKLNGPAVIKLNFRDEMRKS